MNNDKMKYYRFSPLLKTMIWGSESWVISGVQGSETLCDGKGLNELVREQKGRLVGESNYQRFGNEFPLLIKFIDARQNLSIQVHPNDEVARHHGKEHGKTEMWYVLESAPEAMLYNGLKVPLSQEQYKQMVADDTICDALAQFEAKEGDCFFIPAGRIHAIGAGCFLTEIQQTSDVTYRIYDYKRKDKDGNYRQLHTKEAAEAIDYTVHDDYRLQYVPRRNEGQQLVGCPYFNTAVYDLTEPMSIDYSQLDSFVILIGMKGEGSLTVDGVETTLCSGEALLLPAYINNVRVTGTVKFLETYVIS